MMIMKWLNWITVEWIWRLEPARLGQETWRCGADTHARSSLMIVVWLLVVPMTDTIVAIHELFMCRSSKY